MTYAITLPVFEGPVDLLLQLIRKHKLEISEISLVAVTEQYLEILHAMESMDLEVAGEFLVIAATLMEIKSRSLLPQPEGLVDEEGEDPREELLRRLEEYEQFRALSQELRAIEQESRLSFSREAVESHVGAVPMADLGVPDLMRSLRRMLLEDEDADGGRRVQIERHAINLRQRISEVWERLHRSGDRISFVDLVPRDTPNPYRQEALATFLAVLELIRLGMATAWQDSALGDIVVGPLGQSAELPDVIDTYRA